MKWSAPQALLGLLLLGLPFRYLRRRARCDRCEHVWDAAASAPVGPPYRTGTPPPRRAGRPVFRLRRTRAFAGAFWGLSAAPLLALLGGSAAGVAAVAAPLLGILVGRRSGEDLCSDPDCRARLGVRRTICPGCHGSVEGSVASAPEHYIKKAAWHRAGGAGRIEPGSEPGSEPGRELRALPLGEPRALEVPSEASGGATGHSAKQVSDRPGDITARPATDR